MPYTVNKNFISWIKIRKRCRCDCFKLSKRFIIFVVFSLGRFTSWTFFLGICLQTDICVHCEISNPEFKPLTQKIQITKARNFQKWREKKRF